MLDIELLRSFVSVVDAGGFTRAGERVHRTQSTVSQQIKRLEDSVGKPLLLRDGKRATPTEEGERLLSYARRILALEQEARDVVARPVIDGVVRIGIPEDFAAYRLPEVLSDFARSRPTLRLDVRSGLSVNLQAALARSELDIVVYKRNIGEGDGSVGWPERLHWVTSRKHPVDMQRDPIPIAVLGRLAIDQNWHSGRSVGGTRRCDPARRRDHAGPQDRRCHGFPTHHQYRDRNFCCRQCKSGDAPAGGSARGILRRSRYAQSGLAVQSGRHRFAVKA